MTNLRFDSLSYSSGKIFGGLIYGEIDQISLRPHQYFVEVARYPNPWLMRGLQRTSVCLPAIYPTWFQLQQELTRV